MTTGQLAYRAAHYVPWHERIGDSGALGWIAAGAYLAAALLCLRAARRAGHSTGHGRALWLAAGATLLLLGINKQLDLQVALIEFWREAALAHGWYGARRAVQLSAFGLGMAGAAAGLAWLLPLIRRQGAELKAAFAGILAVGAYAALRAAQFQHVLWDAPGQAGPGWLSALELGGIGIVGGAAWFAVRRDPL